MSYNLSDPVKTAMISLTTFILTTGVVALSFAFYHQKEYPPFKAKQLPAVAVSLVAACFWMLGTLQSLAVFDLTNPVWAVCPFWEIW